MPLTAEVIKLRKKFMSGEYDSYMALKEALRLLDRLASKVETFESERRGGE